MTVYSPLIQNVAGVRHGFGDASALLHPSLEPWQQTVPLKKQVHGTDIRRVRRPAELCGEADGLLTSTPGILLHVLTADCLPILFCRRDGKSIGVVHAGWRGLLAGILEAFAEQLTYPDSPANWVAAIGPAAGSCCYEVSESLANDFLRQLTMPAHIVQPRPRHLDLAAIARCKLETLGFQGVDVLMQCTICASDAGSHRYTSYRRYCRQRELDPATPTISGRNQHSGLVII
ncbi:peptidoglycan editing factor PgeF [Acerihabitans sp. KWT182]|uniref:Purine nucleoside phosphorylase n=1 Tax=Acerihabitans sp. KWT182 TaxID=3157919 RepID=A0AAU7Q5T4_9GAMM